MRTSVWVAAALCVMSGTVWSAEELKRADLVGKWQCTFLSGKEGQDVGKFQLEFREDGTVEDEAPPGPGSWFFAKMEDGTALLLMQDGGSDLMTMVVEVKDGEMTWKPFVKSGESKALKPAEKEAYRFKKLEK